MTPNHWQFQIDRGGTFTDVVAIAPDGSLITHKLLSENPGRYDDAVIQGIREVILGASTTISGGCARLIHPTDRAFAATASSEDHPRKILPSDAGPLPPIASLKMGTTVATNALLERKGERTVLVITEGFGDALRIGYQERPSLFSHRIDLPSLLYERVIEARERVDAKGNVLLPLDADAVHRDLRAAFDAGFRAVAIVFLHGYRYTGHERAAAGIARDVGFPQVSVSHEVSPLVKLVGRGDTTVVDAYLSPILRRYVDAVVDRLPDTRLFFMQSNGGLTDAGCFRGWDSILSGPAGGVVGAVATAKRVGFDKIISFDMGGTSTDVAHYAGAFERAFETKVANVRMRVPILRIHTVAAGGGSIVRFQGGRYRVGPESAGANPGPACYRRGGPLTVTDCNVMVGKIAPRFFPAVFGAEGNLSIDEAVVRERFTVLAREIDAQGSETHATGDAPETASRRRLQEIADGFLRIAVQNMANAIKKISIERGYDVTRYTLCAFGAAGGQHACLVADALGMERILIHAHAGVLSAYGMGLADIRALRERSIEAPLNRQSITHLTSVFDALEAEARAELKGQGIDPDRIEIRRAVYLKYAGTDASLPVAFPHAAPTMIRQFEETHESAYGFLMTGREHIVEMVSLEAIGRADSNIEKSSFRPEGEILCFPNKISPFGRDDTLMIERKTRAGNKAGSAAFQDGAAGSAARQRGMHTTDTELDRSIRPLTRVELYTGGQTLSAPVHERRALPPGALIPGPAILVEPNATTIIEPDWRAEVTPQGDLLLTRRTPARRGHWDPRRPGHARGLQQSLHVRRRADGRGPRQYRLFRQHQRTPGFFLRPLRRAGKSRRQRPPHPRPSRLHG
uniref:5-oxoprolinase (ATP-hydrolysing) n=1 Tax=Candidatus Kentrum sp. TC TaxID=2126339 RepID=A0A451A7U6_9GAMM|nr:MAG: 5-oxoprolinase (ATP-hydrolysing) [Candidatus Kentron sp. TC]